MASITELNNASQPTVRKDSDVLAGVVVKQDAAKAARDAARAARETAKQAAAKAKQAAADAKAARESAPKPKTARDAVRDIDKAILEAAGPIAVKIAAEYPEELRSEIYALVSNQLHHLASPKTGWVGTLPMPNRSEWV